MLEPQVSLVPLAKSGPERLTGWLKGVTVWLIKGDVVHGLLVSTGWLKGVTVWLIKGDVVVH